MRPHTYSTTLLCLGLAIACTEAEWSDEEDGIVSVGLESSDTTEPGPDTDDMGGDMGGGDGNPCEGGGDVEFSYIWIANSAQNSVSKIDTKTMVEVGRYFVGPGVADQGPSRTSVNLDGDVAIVNRDGSVTKIFADLARCEEDNNGVAGLQSSTGSDDLLVWGSDDCVAWHTSLPVNARPAAWTIGEPLTDCGFAPAKLWVSAPNPDDPGAATVYLLDGATGDVQAEVPISAADCNCPKFGLYGGAVDEHNDLWSFPRDGEPHGSGPLIHVDFQSLTYDLIPQPPGARAYGITVDAQGRPWLAGEQSLHVYNPTTLLWSLIDIGMLPGSEFILRGLQQDAEGDVWVAAMSGWDPPLGVSSGMLQIDGETLQAVQFVGDEVLVGLIRPTGTSIDVDGGVWLVDSEGDQAFRYDPLLDEAQVFGGLQVPYTYSDMTGHGLHNVVFPPQE